MNAPNASTNFSLPPSLSLSLSLSYLHLHISPSSTRHTLPGGNSSLLSLAAGNHPLLSSTSLDLSPLQQPLTLSPLESPLSLTPANNGPLHSPISLYLFPSSNPSNAPHRQILSHYPRPPRQGPLALSLVETLSLSLGVCVYPANSLSLSSLPLSRRQPAHISLRWHFSFL